MSNFCRAQIVVPRWWKMRAVIDPGRFTIDAGGTLSAVDLRENSALASEVRAKYADVGLVHVKNTGLRDLKAQSRIAEWVLETDGNYQGGANPRQLQRNLQNIFDVGAPLSAHLHYHHEMTYKSHTCLNLAFLCKHAVERPGIGWSFLSDTVQSHDALLETDFGQKLKQRGLCFIRRMNDERIAGPQYNSWQHSWHTVSAEEAEARAKRQGLEVEWLPRGAKFPLMQTRYYKSAFEYAPMLERNILFTSIADDGEWFDSWPELERVPHEERPLEMTFGDGQPFTLEEKQLWVDVYGEFGIPIAWSAGDVAVFCNYRFAHGRPGVHLLSGEKRELGVMLGRMIPRVGALDSKW